MGNLTIKSNNDATTRLTLLSKSGNSWICENYNNGELFTIFPSTVSHAYFWIDKDGNGYIRKDLHAYGDIYASGKILSESGFYSARLSAGTSGLLILNAHDTNYNNVGNKTPSDDATYRKGVLKNICQIAPNSESAVIGRYWPNSYGFLFGNLYNTSEINSEGLPRYCTLLRSNLGGSIGIFGTVDYNFYDYNILTGANYNSYSPTLTGGGASGTWGINITGNSATATKFASTQSISLTGDTTGSASSQAGWSLSTTTKKISYDTQLTTDSAINSFNVANKLQIATWNSTSSPGVPNGIIINGGWTSTDYGFQLAIDDDPTWYIALRQKNASGWNAWKRIPMGDGTGASGTWGINITGTAALSNRLAIKGVASGDNHALALKNYFESNKSSIPRNELTTYFSTAYENGSLYMGYFLGGYDSTPYGGFFVSHYDTPYYVGISYNNYNQQTILTSFNYGSWCAPVSHSHSSYLPLSGGTMTGTLRVNNAPIFGYMYGANNNAAAFIWDKSGSNYTGVGACNIADTIHFGPCNESGTWVANYNQIWRFQGGVYAMGWLETDNYGSSAPDSSTPGYGRGGAIYYQV